MLSFDDHPLRRLGQAAQQVRVSFLLYAFTAVRVHCCTRSLLYAFTAVRVIHRVRLRSSMPFCRVADEADRRLQIPFDIGIGIETMFNILRQRTALVRPQGL
jgi:hypothetical protein